MCADAIAVLDRSVIYILIVYVFRLAVEAEVTVYFSSDNARVYHGRDIQGFVIDDEVRRLYW